MEKLADFDADALLAFAESTLLKRRRLEVDDLAAGAHWAVLHAADPTAEPDQWPRTRRPGGPKLVRVGGEGTPLVQDLCLAELALSRQTHALATRWLVADALDLIHRLPRCWAVVTALECEVWVARKLARATRDLSPSEAAYVDAAVATALAGEQPGRFFTICEAKIIEANPEAWAAKIDAERARRYVSLGRVDENGLRHVIARIEHGDAVWIDAVINRIADILHTQDQVAGAPARDRDLLRSVAFGWLARPAELLTLLLQHADEADNPPEPHPDDTHTNPDDTHTNPGDSRTNPGASDTSAGGEGEPGAADTADDPDSRDHEDRADTETSNRDDAQTREPTDLGGQPDPDRGGQSDPDLGRWDDPTDEDAPDPNPPSAPGANGPASDEPPGSGWAAGFPAHLLDTLRRINPEKLRPSATVYVHLHQAALQKTRTNHDYPDSDLKSAGTVARIENGGGPRLAEHLADLLGHAHISVKPVIDLNERVSINAYEHPQWLRERIHLISPAEPFPHSTRISRKGDIDHPVPYQHGSEGQPAPPGQTGDHNAAPLSRYSHRVKTHAHHTLRQPRPGTYVWRTPHNRWLLVDEDGTHHIDQSLGIALTGNSSVEQHLALLLRDHDSTHGDLPMGTRPDQD